MFEKIIRFAIAQRWLVLLCVLGMAALGIFSYQRLPIDAVPDITNVQVQINTHAPGYSPLESEQRVTFPIETAMAGLPNLEQTRSLSRYGLSPSGAGHPLCIFLRAGRASRRNRDRLQAPAAHDQTSAEARRMAPRRTT